MKVSLNWIKEFTDIKLLKDELIEKIGAQLGAIEEVIETGERYEGALVVSVISCAKHPNADKLSICLVDDGGVTKKIKRDEDSYIKVVCGAPNVTKGQTVIWLPPGATVPATFYEEPLVLEAREIRGIISHGMIASAKELALGDDHSGILVIKENIKPGTPMVDAFNLDDTIIDIENKMFTHRPDLFGHLGIAREIAGIQQTPFKSPVWYTEQPELPKSEPELALTVKNDVAQLVPRFCVIAIANVQVSDSPMWLKTKLARLGVRPINNIVDLTNYLMLETAQPIHAYDYDKLATQSLGIRLSKKGEKVTLLGGKVIELNPGAIVITDGDQSIGLGGVMGGADTEVDKQTKNIVIEVATFDMNRTRQTAMEYGLFTEAATRFTKNQSPKQTLAVLTRAANEIMKLAGGKAASPVIDEKVPAVTKQAQAVTAEAGFINARLGLNLKATQMRTILENVEFKTTLSGDKLAAAAPFWRMDIAIAEDLVEEVGRLYGYDHLPLELPTRTIKPAPRDPELSFKSHLRDHLANKGANEVLTYSFVNESVLLKTGQSSKEAFHIRNALSPDLQYYRLSLLPSLLEKIHPNIKSGYEELSVFELGRAHVKGVEDGEKLPREIKRLGYVAARKQPLSGAAYYQAKWLLEGLLSDLGIYSLNYQPLVENDLPPSWRPAAAVFESAHSAVVYDASPEKTAILAIVGEPRNEIKQVLKLPAFTAMFEADQESLLAAAQPLEYEQLNRYPAIQQDITLRLLQTVAAGDASRLLAEELTKISQTDNHIFDLTLDSIFQKPTDKSHKQITWRLHLWHPERTLTTPEANHVFDMLEAAAKQKFKAERV